MFIKFIRDKSPKFENLPKEQTVSENVQKDAVVYTTRGRDDDKQGDLVYGVIETPPATNYFTMDTRSGQVKVKDAAALKRDGGIQFKVNCYLLFENY